MADPRSRQLKLLGMILFLLGLIAGLILMNFKNPRMGLSAHLEGVMNGLFLVVAGIIWQELLLPARLQNILYATLLYGTFANFTFTLLSAILGTSKTTPIAGAGFSGTVIAENFVTAGLVSVGLSMLVALGLLCYGLGRAKTA
jgi:hydroxylaminobenzene mutase